MFRIFIKSAKLNLFGILNKKISYSMENQLSTAGIIIIGDEILKGEVLDTNSHYLTTHLHEMGIQVKKISIIGDNIDEISSEIKWFSKTYKYVITSGGIGPTHDDVTFEAVAKAFDEPVVMNEELMQKCFEFYKTKDPDSPGMKLAKIPKSAKLNYNKENTAVEVKYPNISVYNVYMFPGIPELLKKSFANVGPSLFTSGKRFHSKCLYCNLTEDKLVESFEAVLRNNPDVQIGSYPKLFDALCSSDYKVKITIESTNYDSTLNAYKELIKLLPQESIVDTTTN